MIEDTWFSSHTSTLLMMKWTVNVPMKKLKPSETAMQSRCAMQLESSELNQTSLANEPWSGSGLDSSLGLLLELLLASLVNVAGGEDGWRACSKGQLVGSESGGDARCDVPGF
jgi:hypothetical protein